VLDRYQRFAGRTLFTGMVSAPLVMPEVIIGLSLLLMLVSVQKMFGFPERGLVTIWLGHTAGHGLCGWWCNRACRR
jgi:putrescine transport system permease protein